MVKYKTKLLDNRRVIADKINKALRKQLEVKVAAFSSAIKDDLPKVLIEAIQAGDVYQSLVGGFGPKNLRAEFGFPDSLDANSVNNIVEAIVGAIIVTHKIKTGSSGISGKIRIQAVRKDLQDALELPQSQIDSKGGLVEWLDWLSFEGDRIVVSGFDIKYGNFNKQYSRSGKAIMRESKGFWKVPAAFSGTKDNNWVTKAIEQSNDKIRDAITTLINKEL